MPPGARPFDGLAPEVVLDAVERLGVRCDGRLLALNSYENRVYRVGLEGEGDALVAKFYRPGRWSDQTVLEEHRFAGELAAVELPVAAPLAGPGGETLLEHRGFRYAVYPCFGGDWPELADAESRRWLGRLLGRIHAVGALGRFAHRASVDTEALGARPREAVLASELLAPEWRGEYERASAELLEAARECFAHVGEVRTLRLHGDCHRGNVLWSREGPTFVDLDDCRNGPAVQDLWMLVSGDAHEVAVQLEDLLEGYTTFHDFERRELRLVEALRALRMMHYAAWLAERWDDPAFPPSFPWFGTAAYWADHVQGLRQQHAAVAAAMTG